ncbi:MAG: hydroxyacid dehydrogenase [Chloroflexi bacterium]|nr:hydroxyacid dehydrogenase [Chloroflexota bacterium]
MARIVVAEAIAAAGLSVLQAAGHEIADLTGKPREALLSALAGADALVVRSQIQVDAALIAAGPQLKIIGRAGVGIDNIDAAAAEHANIRVVNAPNGNTIAAAEQTFALLLAVARHVPHGDASVRSGAWIRGELKGFELRGKRLGIAGFGRIGQAVAKRAAAFEMEITASDPVLTAQQAAEFGVTLQTLDQLLTESDIISLHLPALGDRPLIGAAEIAKMKRGAVLLNVARGSLVDEVALAAALASGALGGAGIDVFASEPPVGSPLLTAPHTVLAPHLGAQTVDAQIAVAVEVAEQIVNFFKAPRA